MAGACSEVPLRSAPDLGFPQAIETASAAGRLNEGGRHRGQPCFCGCSCCPIMAMWEQSPVAGGSGCYPVRHEHADLPFRHRPGRL